MRFAGGTGGVARAAVPPATGARAGDVRATASSSAKATTAITTTPASRAEPAGGEDGVGREAGEGREAGMVRTLPRIPPI